MSPTRVPTLTVIQEESHVLFRGGGGGGGCVWWVASSHRGSFRLTLRGTHFEGGFFSEMSLFRKALKASGLTGYGVDWQRPGNDLLMILRAVNVWGCHYTNSCSIHVITR